VLGGKQKKDRKEQQKQLRTNTIYCSEKINKKEIVTFVKSNA
jgi:hypothetical protein